MRYLRRSEVYLGKRDGTMVIEEYRFKDREVQLRQRSKGAAEYTWVVLKIWHGYPQGHSYPRSEPRGFTSEFQARAYYQQCVRRLAVKAALEALRLS